MSGIDLCPSPLQINVIGIFISWSLFLALSSWKPTHSKTFNKASSARQRDFISINKAATQAGLVTAQEHAQYRATHDVKRKPSAKEQSMKLPKRLPPTMVFGVPTQ